MAVTTNIIPRTLYKVFFQNFIYIITNDFFKYRHGGTTTGFAEASFSTFNTSDFSDELAEINKLAIEQNVAECSFIGQLERRVDVNGSVTYTPTPDYWERLFDRTIFFVIFEVCYFLIIFLIFAKHVVLLAVVVTAFLIPDVPGGLKKRIKRQNFAIDKIMIKDDKGNTMIGVDDDEEKSTQV